MEELPKPIRMGRIPYVSMNEERPVINIIDISGLEQTYGAYQFRKKEQK